MRDTVKYPLVLFCVCVAAGLALAATFALTFDAIHAKEEQKATDAIITAFWNVETPEGARWGVQTPEGTIKKSYRQYATVVDDVVHRAPLDEEAEEYQAYRQIKGTVVYQAFADEAQTRVMGYAAQGSAAGYSSTIKLMVGVAPLGAGKYRLLGAKVISQQETPGLGARMNDVYTSETLWTVLGSIFGGGDGEKPVEAPHLRQAAETLGVTPASFPPRPPFQAQFAGRVVTISKIEHEQKWEYKARGIDLSKVGWAEVAEGRYPEDERTVIAMTGATISSKAVLDAVYDAVTTIHKALEIIGESSK